MKKVVILLFILFISFKSFSQKKFSAELLTGFGFNRDLFIANQEIEAHEIFTVQLNANYKFKLYKRFFGETGIGLQWYFTSGNAAFSSFNATSLRLNIPFIISYPIFEKINIGAGTAIFNNKDIANFDSRTDHNLRMSFVFKGSYTLKEDLSLVVIMNQNISNTPDFFFVHQPNTDVSLGIAYKLF